MKRLLVLAALAASSAALAQDCPTRASWPTTEWPVNLVDPNGPKKAAIEALEGFIFKLEGKDSERKGYRTNSLVIIKNGVIVYEKYARGFDESKRHISWSVAKSYSSALIGIAVHQGALSLDDSVCTHLPEYAGTPQCAIRVKDVITFGTGLQWQEEYEDQTYQVSSVIAMLFGVGHRDQLRHVITHKLVAEPGTSWVYSTGDAHLAAALAKRALSKEHGKDAFWKVLFDPIGASRTIFEEDLKGTPLGGSMVFATPRDFARFGYLFLNDGCWSGQRLVPSGWVAASTTPSAVYVSGSTPDDETPSGYSWWLNRAIAQKNQEKPWPDAPDDAYAAQGHWGQRIIVIPSEDVVIVRTGDDREGSMPANDIIKYSLPVTR